MLYNLIRYNIYCHVYIVYYIVMFILLYLQLYCLYRYVFPTDNNAESVPKHL